MEAHTIDRASKRLSDTVVTCMNCAKRIIDHIACHTATAKLAIEAERVAFLVIIKFIPIYNRDREAMAEKISSPVFSHFGVTIRG